MNQQTEADNRIRFPLLSNGLDFILEAVNRLVGATHRDYKYAVLHLSSGIELVFKERLRRVDWCQVAQRPEELTQSAYEAGNFRSVSLKECLKRLAKHGVCLEDKEEETLLGFRNRRNPIEHFNMVDTVEAIKSSTAIVLSIVFDFIHTELDAETLDQDDQDTLEKIHQRLFELQSFVQARLQEIEPELRQDQVQTTVVTCPQCFQDAAVIDDGLKCLFCRYTADGEDAAESYISAMFGQSKYRTIKNGGVWPQHMCPECGAEALVDMDEGEFICFSCGMSWEGWALQKCERCNEFYVPIDDLLTCEDCFDEYMRRD